MSGFNRFKKPAAEATPPAATPSPLAATVADAAPAAGTKAAPVEQPEAAPPGAVAASPLRGLALAGATALTKSVLTQIAEEPESDFVETFPHILLKGGNSGGQMAPTKATEKGYKEILAQLPQGKQPVQGILMAARAEAIAWPVNYDDKDANTRPSIHCAISLGDADGIGLLLTGSENFQFASADIKRGKWEVPNGGPGHLRPVFQLLVWLPAVQMPVVFQVSPLLKSFRQMAAELTKLTNEEGRLIPRPVTLSPITTPWYDNNVFHYWAADLWLDGRAKDTASAYEAWVGEVQIARPDIAQSVTDWFLCEDLPPSEDAVNKMRQAANMVNPRGRKRSSGGDQ